MSLFFQYLIQYLQYLIQYLIQYLQYLIQYLVGAGENVATRLCYLGVVFGDTYSQPFV